MREVPGHGIRRESSCPQARAHLRPRSGADGPIWGPGRRHRRGRPRTLGRAGRGRGGDPQSRAHPRGAQRLESPNARGARGSLRRDHRHLAGVGGDRARQADRPHQHPPGEPVGHALGLSRARRADRRRADRRQHHTQALPMQGARRDRRRRAVAIGGRRLDRRQGHARPADGEAFASLSALCLGQQQGLRHAGARGSHQEARRVHAPPPFVLADRARAQADRGGSDLPLPEAE